MNLNYAFFNEYGRLRSGWRFALFLAAFVLVSGVLSVLALTVLAGRSMELIQESPTLLLANAILSLCTALGLGYLLGKYIEGLPYRALGAWFNHGWSRHLIIGMLVGAISVASAALIPMIFGRLRFELNPAQISSVLYTLALSFVIFAIAAAFEEALFRGYLLQTFARAGLAWLAIVLTAMFFGFVHLGNPNAGFISSVNTALAGVWFGIAYLKTRDLWFVFGIHWMWNWMQGAVLGIEVSGLTAITKSPLLNEVDTGPAWFTGGEYGLEGSIACTAAIIISIASIYFLPGLDPDPELLAMTNSEIPKASKESLS